MYMDYELITTFNHVISVFNVSCGPRSNWRPLRINVSDNLGNSQFFLF